MEVKPSDIAIVGCGPGSPQYVTPAAQRAVATASVLVGSKRLLGLFPELAAHQVAVHADTGALSALLEDMARWRASGQRVAVLVSGDPGLYSLAHRVVRHFGRATCEIIPGVSSVQVAFARLGLDWADARILSAHGRTPQLSSEELRPIDKIAILAGTPEALCWSASVAAVLAPGHIVFLAENLTLENERFRQLTVEQLGTTEAASLSIVLLIGRSLWA
jgi:cobalt-precorrin-7 (C5)-methyltransferase